MANNETDLELTVGAVADKNSAKKAVQDIAKEVNNSVKGGRIDITIPIDVNKDKLTKAQKDVVAEISKLTSKGFSASGKDIDKLTSKFNEFTKTFDQAGKGRQNKLFREIRKQVEDLQKLYKESQNVQKATRVYDTKIKNSKTSKRKTNYISDEEIAANIKAEQKRRSKGLKQAGPKGYGSGWVDPGRTNEHEAKMSEMSSYKSNMARQMRQSELESQSWVKDSLKVTKLNPEAIERILAKGNNKPLSPTKKAQWLSEDLRNNTLPELLRKIQKSEDETEINTLTEKFFDTIDAISKLNQDAGKSVFGSVKKDLDVVMRKLGFSVGGKIGGTEGKDKTAKSRDPKMEGLLKGLLAKIEQKENAIREEIIKLEQLEKNPSTKSSKEINSFANKIVAETKTNNDVLKRNAKATESQTTYDKIENAAERVADTKSEQLDTEIKSIEQVDAEDGMNSETNAQALLQTLAGFKSLFETCPCEEILTTISNNVKLIVDNLGKPIENTKKDILEKSGLPMVISKQISEEMAEVGDKIRILVTEDQEKVKYAEARHKRAENEVEEERELLEKGEHPLQKRSNKMGLSKDSLFDKNTILRAIKEAFESFGLGPSAKKIIAMNQEEQEKLQAKRIRTFGLLQEGRAGGIGDLVRIFRRKTLWGRTGENPFENLKLTDSLGNINSKDITNSLQKLIERNMFTAQTGGALRNLVGSMTGYIGMPSLEKSRAQADAANQMMANIRDKALDLIQTIQDKETTLRGMESSGDIVFDDSGAIINATEEARALFVELENSKMALDGVLADANVMDKLTIRTGGNLSKIFKQLGFVSPELRENNKIIQNINAGLNKSGKALKFQTRTGEVLNYTFQLMARHVGQIWKNWILQLNPITQIKKAFKEFTSYNTKWQRTMNVIKYNIHAILEPFMDKIAQFLVNCIGFVDIISMKVQKAFGYMPVSLFDQAAASSQKIKEELEAAANVTAGFDELHDIGSDNSGANDLLGSIYKPQLSQEWIDLANRIGDLFAGVITGDLGFGEVMKEILKILWDGLKLIAKTIWDWFKQTAIGKYITTHWKDILGTMLKIFLGWQLLKIASKLLWNALFGSFGEGAVGGLFSKIGGWITSGFSTLWKSGGLIGAFKAGGASLGTIFGGALAAAAGVAIAVGGITYFGNKADKNSAYNYRSYGI